METKTHIIIGTSAAGMGCAGRLAALAPNDNIIIMSQEAAMPYNTCLLADVLGGQRSFDGVALRQLPSAVEVRLGVRVESIDPSARTISCSDGSALKYDNLFLGTGTSVHMPQISGLEAINTQGVASVVHTFHTLQDTQQLLASMKDIRRAVIVGAGLSGIECADALAAHGIAVDLIEMAGRLLPRQLDDAGSRVIEQVLPQFGVALHKNVSLTGVQDKSVLLSSGTTLPYDALIFTTGGRPNITLAHNAGCVIAQGGVLVNEFMQTSVPGVYAGGDCATVHNQLTGEPVRSCLWPDAMQQGMHAAFAMAGQPKPYPGVCIVSSSRFFDTVFVSCGPVVEVPEHAKVAIECGDGFYHKFVYEGERLLGFLQVGNVTNVGELRKQVLTGPPE